MPVTNNNRIFYACQAVAIQPLTTGQNGVLNPGTATILHGVQSVGINTSFNLEQIFELGQIHIYENIEGIPDVEITLEKILDGYPLMYHVATSAVNTDSALTTPAARASLVGRSKQRCNAYLGLFPDTVEHIGDTADVAVEVLMSGLYISSISYSMPVDGNSTESLTLVGNHKQWFTTPVVFNQTFARSLGSGIGQNQYYDQPFNSNPANVRGGVQRRENFDVKNSMFPMSINGVTKTKQIGNGFNAQLNKPNIHLQNCSISCDLSREDIQELGRRSPYTRYANFPVEVTCEFELIATSGDFINALEEGDTTNFPITNPNHGSNTAQEQIIIKLHDGTVFDLGTQNRLSSVNYTGGDAGGGNATITYSYSTFNHFSVYHPQDPAAVVGTAPFDFKYNGNP